MNGVYIRRNREAGMGAIIKKLPHPYMLSTKITIKMRGDELL